ncbi:Proteophosphoglycan ppg4 [Rhodotorula toruloides ATCC 204091]|uniref:Proteophosphoglycan ppg4 n=1 Tax=Rhodotorula toruloides TaxID=5286 RepID=A0A0K3CJA1_RHOTO|nr:Proteophosphoglycan ppg4 [Rhodotorula toruloides ATCC 204091]KAK4336494.1 Proteophosphoglycan ppg4 [Rhodotorula toruloides]PRQ74179.1 Proteophosphoglycan ppg4 [Rhodotorula toruloides]
MHRVAQKGAAPLRSAAKQLATPQCRCFTSSPRSQSGTKNLAKAAAREAANGGPKYSFPQDAFTSTSEFHPTRVPLNALDDQNSGDLSDHIHSRLSHISTETGGRRRQRQTLSNAEAQAFADLLVEILPRSLQSGGSPDEKKFQGPVHKNASPGGAVFDLFLQNGGSPALSPGVERVQRAVLAKVAPRSGLRLDEGTGRWERRAKASLTEDEELELDKLKQELVELKSDVDLFEWSMKHVFGLSPETFARYKSPNAYRGIFPDPTTIPVNTQFLGAAFTEPKTPLERAPGVMSRLFPDLLHLVFLVLRDVHHNPAAALAVFSLAASNPYSYINGCSAALYVEVLKTRWSEGDVESVLSTMEEMRASGIRLDEKVRQLVSAIGEAVRVDAERAEAWVEYLVEQGHYRDKPFEGPHDREREIMKRRFFDSRQLGAWSRMEMMVEEEQDEFDAMRRERENEKLDRQERARLRKIEAEAGLERPRQDIRGREEKPIFSADRTAQMEETASPKPAYPQSAFLVARNKVGIADRADNRKGSWQNKLTERQMSRLSVVDKPWEKWDVPEPEMIGGELVLPRTPSFLNKYKINRAGKTKEEKAWRDQKHPALWWK